jgi:hypothetical protein
LWNTGRSRVDLGWRGHAARLSPCPGEKENEEGDYSQCGWQQQAETAPGALLRGLNWPEWEFG